MSDARTRARLLRTLPDVPRWIEARALVLTGAGRAFEDAGGLALRNESPGGELVVLVGRPGRELLLEALSDREGRQLLCAPEDAPRVLALLPGWRVEPACLFALAEPERLAPADPRVRRLRPDDPLAPMPAELRAELARAAAEREVHALFEDGLAVSFAYAYWRTEGQFDLSIDTAPDSRRRGFARLAASALIRAELSAGRLPVWGAMESNLASRCLAASLGFAEVDRVAILAPG